MTAAQVRNFTLHEHCGFKKDLYPSVNALEDIPNELQMTRGWIQLVRTVQFEWLRKSYRLVLQLIHASQVPVEAFAIR